MEIHTRNKAMQEFIYSIGGWGTLLFVIMFGFHLWYRSKTKKQTAEIKVLVDQRTSHLSWKKGKGYQDKMEGSVTMPDLEVTEPMRKFLPLHLKDEDWIFMMDHPCLQEEDRNMCYVGKDRNQIQWLMNKIIKWELEQAQPKNIS